MMTRQMLTEKAQYAWANATSAAKKAEEAMNGDPPQPQIAVGWAAVAKAYKNAAEAALAAMPMPAG